MQLWVVCCECCLAIMGFLIFFTHCFWRPLPRKYFVFPSFWATQEMFPYAFQPQTAVEENLTLCLLFVKCMCLCPRQLQTDLCAILVGAPSLRTETRKSCQLLWPHLTLTSAFYKICSWFRKNFLCSDLCSNGFALLNCSLSPKSKMMFPSNEGSHTRVPLVKVSVYFQSIHNSSDMFQTLCITPESLAFDILGSVCFLDLASGQLASVRAIGGSSGAPSGVSGSKQKQ